MVELYNLDQFRDAVNEKREEETDDDVDKRYHACKCLACDHEWLVLRNEWTFLGIECGFPCPECDLSRGQLQYQVSPPEGQDIHRCACGSTNWHIILKGSGADLFCVGCGDINLKAGNINDTH